MLLFNTPLQAFIARQTAFRAAVAQSFSPIASLPSSDVVIEHFANFSGGEFARRVARERRLLAAPPDGPGIHVHFSIAQILTVQSTDWDVEDLEVGDRLRSLLESAGFPVVSVVRAQVYPPQRPRRQEGQGGRSGGPSLLRYELTKRGSK